MAGMIQGWLDAYKGSHVCSVQIWKEAFDHFDREPKKFETNEICSIMDTQITGWKRAGVTDFQRKDMADREAGSGKEQKKRVATNRIKMDLQS